MLSIHELIPDLTQMNVERNREKLPDENVFDRKTVIVLTQVR
jgi:hypothetical protein